MALRGELQSWYEHEEVVVGVPVDQFDHIRQFLQEHPDVYQLTTLPRVVCLVKLSTLLNWDQFIDQCQLQTSHLSEHTHTPHNSIPHPDSWPHTMHYHHRGDASCWQEATEQLQTLQIAPTAPQYHAAACPPPQALPASVVRGAAAQQLPDALLISDTSASAQSELQPEQPPDALFVNDTHDLHQSELQPWMPRAFPQFHYTAAPAESELQPGQPPDVPRINSISAPAQSDLQPWKPRAFPHVHYTAASAESELQPRQPPDVPHANSIGRRRRTSGPCPANERPATGGTAGLGGPSAAPERTAHLEITANTPATCNTDGLERVIKRGSVFGVVRKRNSEHGPGMQGSKSSASSRQTSSGGSAAFSSVPTYLSHTSSTGNTQTPKLFGHDTQAFVPHSFTHSSMLRRSSADSSIAPNSFAANVLSPQPQAAAQHWQELGMSAGDSSSASSWLEWNYWERNHRAGSVHDSGGASDPGSTSIASDSGSTCSASDPGGSTSSCPRRAGITAALLGPRNRSSAIDLSSASDSGSEDFPYVDTQAHGNKQGVEWAGRSAYTTVPLPQYSRDSITFAHSGSAAQSPQMPLVSGSRRSRSREQQRGGGPPNGGDDGQHVRSTPAPTSTVNPCPVCESVGSSGINPLVQRPISPGQQLHRLPSQIHERCRTFKFKWPGLEVELKLGCCRHGNKLFLCMPYASAAIKNVQALVGGDDFAHLVADGNYRECANPILAVQSLEVRVTFQERRNQAVQRNLECSVECPRDEATVLRQAKISFNRYFQYSTNTWTIAPSVDLSASGTASFSVGQRSRQSHVKCLAPAGSKVDVVRWERSFADKTEVLTLRRNVPNTVLSDDGYTELLATQYDGDRRYACGELPMIRLSCPGKPEMGVKIEVQVTLLRLVGHPRKLDGSALTRYGVLAENKAAQAMVCVAPITLADSDV